MKFEQGNRGRTAARTLATLRHQYNGYKMTACGIIIADVGLSISFVFYYFLFGTILSKHIETDDTHN